MKKTLLLLLFVALLVACLCVTAACKDCAHEHITETVTKQPTCLAAGELVTQCDDCGEKVKTEPISANHQQFWQETVAKQPTCDEQGEIDVRCTECDLVVERKFSPALTHNFGNWNTTVEPTATTQGLATRVCVNDNSHVQTQTLPVLNDTDYVVSVTPATCTSYGEAVYSGICGSYKVTLPKALHTYDDNSEGYCAECKQKYYSIGLTYTLSEDKTYYIVSNAGYGLSDAHAAIPAEYKGLPVKEIASEAFVDKKWLKSIVIPEYIEKIGGGAFNGSGLTTVYFNAINCNDFNGRNWVFNPVEGSGQNISLVVGARVERIPARLFFPLATNPTKVPVVNSVTFEQGSVLQSIGDYAFYKTAITSVELPNSVQTVGDYAFYGTKISKLTLGNNVTTLGAYAFSACEQLTTVQFGSKLQNIGNDCFNYCIKLQQINLANTAIKTIGDDAFKGCVSASALMLGENLQTVGKQAFQGCVALTSVHLPNSVTTLGEQAFEGCGALATLTLGSGLQTVGNGAFENCSALATLFFNATNCNDFAAGNGIFSNLCADGLTVTVGEGVIRLPARMFCGSANPAELTKINSITIAKTVTTVGDNAFFGVTVGSATYLGASGALTVGANNSALTAALGR